MKIHLVVCFLIGIHALGTSAAPVEWPVSEGGNGHYYQVVNNTGYRWILALAIASNMSHAGLDGHLATFTSAEEESWVFENVLSTQGIRGRVYHLGGWAAHMFGHPGGLDGWQWITGQPWDYENWAPGEPNNAGGASAPEKCLAYHYYYYHRGEYLIGWNDVADDVRHSYIVEYDDEDASNHPPDVPVPVRVSTWGRVKALFR